jgi:predicted RND superfamily exporter protein
LHLNSCIGYYAKSFHELSQLDLNSIPEKCLNKLLINTHKYLIDKFLKFENENNEEMRAISRYTSIYLSINKRDYKYLLNLYKTKLKSYKFNTNFIFTYNFQIKYDLFNESILESMFYLILAMLCILVITILYLKSVLITFIILICVLFSLLISYFIYKIVFQLKFFPFINIMSIFLLIGLACDDVFVFYDTWLASKKKKIVYKKNVFENPIYYLNESEAKTDETTTPKTIETKNILLLKNQLGYTFKHAINSIIVTTLTTAAVFLVNLSSNIITIRLFGLFSCLTILNDFIFMIVLIPSILVLYSRYENKFKCLDKFASKLKFNWLIKIKILYKKIFHTYLPNFIIKLRFFLISLFLLLGSTSLIWIFYKPGLKLPTTSTFQLFSSKNPFEYYDKHVSVMSSTNGLFHYQLNSVPYLNLYYIFGVNLKQNTFGSLWHPDDVPDDDEDIHNAEHLIKFDTVNFNFYNEHTQLWFQKFCQSLRFQNHTVSNDDYIPTMEIFSKHKLCLFDHLIPILTSECKTTDSDINSICCGQQTFPFDDQLLKYCLSNKDFIKRHLSENELFFYEKLFYNKTTGFINAVQYQHLTLYTWNANYKDFEKLYSKIERFFTKKLKYSLFNLDKCAFFTSDFEFYDLQKSLYDSTIQSFLISLLCVTVIMFIATGNLLVTLYSILTIMFAISTTIGVLALLEWQLNVIESITIILAIGLSIDFTVHFGVTYCSMLVSATALRSSQISTPTTTIVSLELSKKKPKADRLAIIKESVNNLGSAVLMGSLTTFLAGASMMPSPLLSFQLYGTFLMLVMLFSVTFAFFLFLPLLAVVGPVSNLFQFNWSEIFSKCFGGSKKRNVKKKIVTKKNVVRAVEGAEPRENIVGKFLKNNRVTKKVEVFHI